MHHPVAKWSLSINKVAYVIYERPRSSVLLINRGGSPRYEKGVTVYRLKHAHWVESITLNFVLILRSQGPCHFSSRSVMSHFIYLFIFIVAYL